MERPEGKLLTTTEAAKIIGVKHNQISALIREKKMWGGTEHVGRQPWMIPADEVERVRKFYHTARVAGAERIHLPPRPRRNGNGTKTLRQAARPAVAASTVRQVAIRPGSSQYRDELFGITTKALYESWPHRPAAFVPDGDRTLIITEDGDVYRGTRVG